MLMRCELRKFSNWCLNFMIMILLLIGVFLMRLYNLGKMSLYKFRLFLCLVLHSSYQGFSCKSMIGGQSKLRSRHIGLLVEQSLASLPYGKIRKDKNTRLEKINGALPPTYATY